LTNSRRKMNEINDGILKVSTTATEFSYAESIFIARTREAAAYSPFPPSNTHLVYTTEDLRPAAVELTHFFDCARAARKEHLCTANWLSNQVSPLLCSILV
jgi:hypothetical protein